MRGLVPKTRLLQLEYDGRLLLAVEDKVGEYYLQDTYTRIMRTKLVLQAIRRGTPLVFQLVLVPSDPFEAEGL